MKYLLAFILIISAQFLTSCASTPNTTPEVVTQAPNTNRMVLYWENTTEKHPERKPWSDELTSIVREDLPIYEKAKDITEVCPKWKSLSQDLKVKGVSEYWVAKAYYESSYNPASNSVDVGTKGDLGSYSVGLYQMSGNDGAAQKYKATFTLLKDPIINIRVATEQMRRQINKCGEVFLPNSSPCRYWAVALRNNKYSKIPEIKARVLKYAPECK